MGIMSDQKRAMAGRPIFEILCNGSVVSRDRLPHQPRPQYHALFKTFLGHPDSADRLAAGRLDLYGIA